MLVKLWLRFDQYCLVFVLRMLCLKAWDKWLLAALCSSDPPSYQLVAQVWQRCVESRQLLVIECSWAYLMLVRVGRMFRMR